VPYLRRIGERLGPYGIHSCGNWERTVASAIEDPNLRVMNGQVRENDLVKLCHLAKGRVTLSIGPSENLDERYTWPDTDSFFEYVLAIVPDRQPLEIAVRESDWGLWTDLHDKDPRTNRQQSARHRPPGVSLLQPREEVRHRGSIL